MDYYNFINYVVITMVRHYAFFHLATATKLCTGSSNGYSDNCDLRVQCHVHVCHLESRGPNERNGPEDEIGAEIAELYADHSGMLHMRLPTGKVRSLPKKAPLHSQKDKTLKMLAISGKNTAMNSVEIKFTL